MESFSNLVNSLYNYFLSEKVKGKGEKIIIYVAIASFLLPRSRQLQFF